ncbi:MAG: sugar phosphate isomerase/epimerase [Acidobacteria bacterium]|nr:sugar phosphate isomerase/epimerase [Acidobacteriota bacterium]
MKIGVFTVLLANKPLEEALDYLKDLGVEAVEIGCGAYPGEAHCKPAELLASETKLKAFQNAIKSRGLIISGLSVHGNPIHPNKKLAKEHHNAYERALKLARKLDVDRVITFSGCPGADAKATSAAWIVSPWPPDFAQALEWQWKERVVPYWKEAIKLAKSNGIKKVALEMHPNFVVYNPETLLKLRNAVGPEIGCNFDPSHLFWQGADVGAAIRAVGDAIFHFHAKDCKLDPRNIAVNGVLDAKSYTDELHRSWIFRTCGYGNDFAQWKDIVSNLRLVGYDHVMSIEHEDSLMSAEEGLRKAFQFLKSVVIAEKPGAAYWA